MNLKEIDLEIEKLNKLKQEILIKDFIKKLSYLTWYIDISYYSDSVYIFADLNSNLEFIKNNKYILENGFIEIDDKFNLINRKDNLFSIEFYSFQDYVKFQNKFNFKINYGNFHIAERLKARISTLENNINLLSEFKNGMK